MQKRNILLIDDDCVAHLIVRKTFLPLTWVNRIDSAFNGQEGLEMLERFCKRLVLLPDIILVDLHMPVMDGFGFLESFNKMNCLKPKGLVVIVVSSSECPEEHKRARSLGVKHFFSKPISLEKIEAVLS